MDGNGRGEERKFRRLLAIAARRDFLPESVWPWIPTPAVDPKSASLKSKRCRRVCESCCSNKSPPPPPPKPVEPEPEPEPEAQSRIRSRRWSRMNRRQEPEPFARKPEPKIDYAKRRARKASGRHCCRSPTTWRISRQRRYSVASCQTRRPPLPAAVGEAAARNGTFDDHVESRHCQRRHQHREHEPQYRRWSGLAGRERRRFRKPGCGPMESPAGRAPGDRVPVPSAPHAAAKKSSSSSTRTRVQSLRSTIAHLRRRSDARRASLFLRSDDRTDRRSLRSARWYIQ